MRNMIVASTSTIHGSGYLEYLLDDLIAVFKQENITELLFIPFARPAGISHDDYTQKVHHALLDHKIKVTGIHTIENKADALMNAQAIFTGGGNTFQLVKTLHNLELMQPLRKAIFNGTFYIGTSAGSNICGLNMRTTNDMPVVQPASFKTTGALGYNINPHYLDPVNGSTHMGETREQRIKEFHIYNNIPVIGLREGSYIRVQDKKEILHGAHTARVFLQNQSPIEVESGYDFAQLV
ncbi:MAG: dipeptidase PepE [Nonlabens sp.]|uniref:dipeptidase PepE n=1 Tax=Nonlabens sp. TaxID=1888209 RepID=UPI003EF52F29